MATTVNKPAGTEFLAWCFTCRLFLPLIFSHIASAVRPATPAMTGDSLWAPSDRLLLLFMGDRVRNVSFVLDTSEAMFFLLGPVKRLLIQTLLTKASMRDSLFNIIAFSHKVTQLRDRMVTCTPDSVCEVLGWIHSLSCSPGWDVLGALRAALSDPSCQAVHVVTVGTSEHPRELLQEVPGLAQGRPVNVFYLCGELSPEDSTPDYLQSLSLATGGSCHALELDSHSGVFRKSTDTVPSLSSWGTRVCLPHYSYRSPLHCCVFSTHHVPSYRAQITTGTLVLAQREVDGFYYLGTVRDELCGRRGLFLVEFDKPAWPGGPTLQQTSVTSMLNHSEAHSHSLVPGDKVLAPWGVELNRYAPGQVLTGTELRDPLSAKNTHGLRVQFWTGQEASVPGDTAVWISSPLYQRLVKELRQLPLPGCCCHGNTDSHACCVPMAPPCGCLWWPLVPSEEEWRELEKKVDLQLMEFNESPCEEDAETREVEVMSQGVNTDLSMLPRPQTASHARPDWKYWGRSHQKPQHWPRGESPQATRPTHPTSAELWTGDSTNRSSLYQPLPNPGGKRVTVRDLLCPGESGHNRSVRFLLNGSDKSVWECMK